MSKFRKVAIAIIAMELLISALLNFKYLSETKTNEGRLYKVETARVARELQKVNGDVSKVNLRNYRTIISIKPFSPKEICNNDYVVEEVDGALYRIEYKQTFDYFPLVYTDIASGCFIILTIVILAYIYKKILKPFETMTQMTTELARGNLAIPLKQEKSKYFGSFLWGVDMLREHLENDKEKELALQKEKKTLILSLSHDIKTPLSAIELYSNALSKNLYDTDEKRREALDGINKNVKKINNYLNEIILVSRENFLNLEAKDEECYLSEIIEPIKSYYKEKFGMLHTGFEIGMFREGLIKGDRDRLIEVMQNIIENAIKYGDGKSVRISFDTEEDCRLVTVINSGCSLKKEELPNIFDSFYRGSNSHNVKGNGLGLYICKTLMKMMDGDIYAKAEGASFAVTIVIRQA